MTRVTHIYSGNRFGGIEVLLLQLQEQRETCAQMAPSFVLCFDGLLAKKLRALGATVALLGDVRMSRPWTVLRAQLAFARNLRREKPDVIICHETWSYTVAAPVAKILGVPIIAWFHNPLSGYSLETTPRLLKPDLAFACSDYVASSLKGLIAAERIKTAFTPIPEPSPSHLLKRKETRHKLGVNDDKPVILFAGRLSSYKGQRDLLNALALLKDCRFHAWITGNPQNDDEKHFLSELKQQCADTGLDQHVSFLGFVENMSDVFAAADIYCQPNNSPEPYGLSFIEALYFGMPVVATDFGGPAEILKDSATGQRFGILVKPCEPALLAAALRTLLTDASKRSAYKNTAPARARALSQPSVALNRIFGFLNEALSKSRQ